MQERKASDFLSAEIPETRRMRLQNAIQIALELAQQDDMPNTERLLRAAVVAAGTEAGLRYFLDAARSDRPSPAE